MIISQKKIKRRFSLEAISRYPLQVLIRKAIFPSPKRSFRWSLFGKEKLAFLIPGFPLLSRLGVHGFAGNF